METREDIPLKTGSKSSSLHRCNEYFFEGSRFVTTAFVFLTSIITIALILQIYYGDFQVIPHGSVATDSRDCSEIGTLILKQGGNAVDAAIAAAICVAVVCPHTSGLDASSTILIYNHKTREQAISFNFIEYLDVNQTFPKLIVNLAQLHELYGHLSWRSIIEPSAELATHGFLLSNQLAQAIKKAKVKNLFKQVDAGERMILENLATTLRVISDIPAKEIYKQVKYAGKISKSQVTKKTIRNDHIFYPKFQNMGDILFFNLEHIRELNFTKNNINEIDYIFNLANITKTVYTKYNVLSRFHQSTISNIAVMDSNDLYVSLVTGMYSPFGSQQMLDSGYILDIRSSMPYSILPLIVTDAKYICGERIVFGINDISVGSQIITSWIYGIRNSTATIEYPRFVVLNNTIGFEDDRDPKFNDDVINKLQMLSTPKATTEPYNSCNFVEKIYDDLNSHSDSRGGGISSRF